MNVQAAYLRLKEQTRIHMLPSGGVLEIDYMKEQMSADEFEYFDLNQTAYELCLRMDGSMNALDILNAQCEAYQENPQNHKEWYNDFIKTFIEKGVIEELENMQYRAPIVSGSRNYPAPLHATFELTHKCNLQCEHCYLESSPFQTASISLENFKRMADELYEKGVLTCEITGGEIFVHPQAKEILLYILQKFKKVAVLTNGTLLRNEILEILKQYKHKIVVGISLDSSRSELHDRFRGKQGAFYQTCRTIEKLSGEGVFVRVAMSVFEENMWEIGELAERVEKLGGGAFSYNWVDDFGRGRSMQHPAKNAEVYQKFSKFESEILERFKGLIPIIPYDRKHAANCGAGWRSIIVDPNGNVRPCALFPKHFSLGNLFDDGYEAVFSSPNAQKLWQLKAPRFSDHCSEECSLRNYCGGCYLKGLNANQNHRDEHCAWVEQEGLEPILELL